MMNSNKFTIPAEWEHQKAVLLSWPHKDTDWNYMLDEVTECFVRLTQAIVNIAHVLIVAPNADIPKRSLEGNVDSKSYTIVEMPTNDTWARDFGMICLKNGGSIKACDFKFNGWGLKFPACYDNLITRRLFDKNIIPDEVYYSCDLDFVLEGGSIDVDGCGSLLTTEQCLLSLNRNGSMSKEEIEDVLKSRLGVSRVMWLRHGGLIGDDTDSHIDTLARFISPTVIAYSSCDREGDEHFEELKRMEDELKAMRTINGEPYELVPLPIPSPIIDEKGERLPATYANFLILNETVLIPTYNDKKYDENALSNITKALPGYDILPIDCRALIKQHGSLHCVTMQLPFLI